MSGDMYDIARKVTDEVLGDGTYAEINKGNPDPGVQAAIARAPKPDELVMFTSEIGTVEFNTLRDEMTILIPEDFDVLTVHPNGIDGPTEVRLTRRQE